MKKQFINLKLLSVPLAFVVAQGISYAMPGMHGSGSGAATEHPRVSNSIAGKINSTGSEMEITYSADGKTAIFVSTREGSIQESVGIKANLLRQWDSRFIFPQFIVA